MAGALGVVITTDVPMSGQHAQPVYVDDSLPIVGPSRAIVVTSGEVPLMGGPAIPVRLAPAGTPAIGPALPVYVIPGGGSLGNVATFRNADSSGTAAAGTSLIIPVPAGVQNGDVMLAAVAIRGGSGVSNLAIAGWANLFTTNQSTNVQLGVFFKVASSEPASYTATWTGSFNAAGAIYAAYNANQGTPTNGNQANAPSVNVVAPSVSPAAPALLVFIGGMSASVTFTPPGTMQERIDRASTAGATNAAITFADESLGSGGATGTRTAVANGSGGNVGALIAFVGA